MAGLAASVDLDDNDPGTSDGDRHAGCTSVAAAPVWGQGNTDLGDLGLFVRFLSLALRPPLWLAVAGTLLHGVGFACFTMGGRFISTAGARIIFAPALRH
jgi:hypothetical protein